MKFRHALAFGVALSAISTPALSQDATTGEQAAEEENTIFVTAVARGGNELETSVSLLSLIHI